MKIHERKCWDCGNVAEHTDSITPEVLCKNCGSQDTRPVRKDQKPPRGHAAAYRPPPMSDPEVVAQFQADAKVIADLRAQLAELRREHQRIRRILAHVPGAIVIKAKEAAGFPNYVRTAEG